MTIFTWLNIFDTCMEDANDNIEEQKKSVGIDTLPYFTKEIDPYVCVFENVLQPNECKEIIKIFNDHNDLHFIGRTFSGISKIKQTTDLLIEPNINNKFKMMDYRFSAIISEYLRLYQKNIQETHHNNYFIKTELVDTGYQIQKYKQKKGYYTTHTDDLALPNENNGINARVITFILYLNTVDKGGETVFIDKCKISPSPGKLLFFPSTWTYPHCGMIPESGDKYIMTGWLYLTGAPV